jgi:uncharacterized protein YndB with AHSA1/START domain
MSENVKLQVKKVIKAKRQSVFDAWTKPELMKQWYAPGAMVTPNAQSDLKVGGAYMVEMKGEMEGEFVNPTATGKYTQIVPNELLSFTWGWVGDPSAKTLVTVEFKDVDGGTEVTLTHEQFEDKESRDNHLKGWTGCLENLARFCGK